MCLSVLTQILPILGRGGCPFPVFPLHHFEYLLTSNLQGSTLYIIMSSALNHRTLYIDAYVLLDEREKITTSTSHNENEIRNLEFQKMHHALYFVFRRKQTLCLPFKFFLFILHVYKNPHIQILSLSCTKLSSGTKTILFTNH